MKSRSILVLVGIGGALGALARAGILSGVGEENAVEALVVVNLAGSLGLGLVVGLARSSASRHERWRALWGMGFCGGFTSLSGFAVNVVDVGAAEESFLSWNGFGAAIGLTALTTLGALSAVALGLSAMGHRSNNNLAGQRP